MIKGMRKFLGFLILLVFLFSEKQIYAVDLLNIMETEKEIENYISDCASKGFFKSFAIGVVNTNGLVYENCYMTPLNKTYEIASISKTFTAACVMKLVEEKLIDLDTPLVHYLPGVDIRSPELDSQPVTIRHLLSHSSGLPDVRYYTPRKVNQFPGISFTIPNQIYPAGMHYRYSNHGFMLLGKVIEKVTDLSYHECIKKYIYLPAKMTNAEVRKNATGAYGIRLSLMDMAHYAYFWIHRGQSISGEQVLSPASIEMMLKTQFLEPPAKQAPYVGLGWRVEADEKGVLTFFHIGGDEGVSAWIQIFPRNGIAVFYLGNPSPYSPELFLHLVAIQGKLTRLATFFSGKQQSIYTFAPSQMPKADYNKLVGIYSNTLTTMKGEVFLEKGILGFKNPQEVVRLQPCTMHSFLGGSEGLSYDFIFKKDFFEPIGLATYYGYFIRLTKG